MKIKITIFISLLMVVLAFSAQALTLRDRANKPIGKVIDTEAAYGDTGMLISVFRGDATYLLRATRTTIEATHAIEYASADCTGASMGIYMYPGENESAVFWAAAIAPPGRTVYMQRRAAPPVPIITASWYDSKTQECYPISDPVEVEIHQVMPIHNLDATYTPPYLIKPKLEPAN